MEFSHINSDDQINMVDISAKKDTNRRAIASSLVRMKSETQSRIKENTLRKGNVLATARLAGIMASKRTSDLIPLCHPIRISQICIDFEFVSDDVIKVVSLVQAKGSTGVEMEALMATSIASLTIYDMIKSVDRCVTIECLKLELKKGGKSGRWERKQ